MTNEKAYELIDRMPERPVGLKIVYSKFALQDLKNIYDFIRKDPYTMQKRKRIYSGGYKKIKVKSLFRQTIRKVNRRIYTS